MTPPSLPTAPCLGRRRPDRPGRRATGSRRPSVVPAARAARLLLPALLGLAFVACDEAPDETPGEVGDAERAPAETLVTAPGVGIAAEGAPPRFTPPGWIAHPDMAAALRAERDGAPEEADALWAGLAAAEPTSEAGRAAALALARRGRATQDVTATLRALAPYEAALQEDAAADLTMPPAGFWLLGQALREAGRARDAAVAFARYAERQPAMADQAALDEGAVHADLGAHEASAAAYERALASAVDETTAALAGIRLGNAQLSRALAADGPDAGEAEATMTPRPAEPVAVEAALAAYREAEARAQDAGTRVQALAGVISALAAADRDDEANQERLRLLAEMPEMGPAAISLGRLDAAGVAVPAAHAARALWAAEGPQAAIARLLAEGALDGDVGYEAAIVAAEAYRAQGDDAAALAALERGLAGEDEAEGRAALHALRAEILAGAEPAAAESAWLGLAEAASTAGDEEAAAEARLALASLYGAARPAEAEAVLEAVAAGDADEALRADARFRAGWLAWRRGELTGAAGHWAAVPTGADDGERARFAYWRGRLAEARGATAEAQAEWRAAAGLEAGGYYAARARQRLAAAGLAGPSRRVGTGAAPEAELAPYRDEQAAADPRSAEIGAWLGRWRPGFGPADWAETRAAVAGRREVVRAAEWLLLGQRLAALAEMRRAAAALGGDAPSLAALALEAERLGLVSAALGAARGALAAAPVEADPAAGAVWRLAYPDPWPELVREAAEAHGAPRPLLLALVWQESRFEPAAGSGAGALGLAQLMPGTAEHVAGMLGEPTPDAEALKRPALSLRYGAWFLAQSLVAYDGAPAPALVAYNAGPGIAARWWSEAGSDLDTFVELVGYEETRLYLDTVLPAYEAYLALADTP